YSSWADVFAATNLATANPSTLQAEYGASDSYPAYSRAALASLYTATGDVRDIEAYDVVTTAMAKAGAMGSYHDNAQWDIAPRMSDGSYLLNGDIHVGAGSTGNTFAAVTRAQLISDTGSTSSTLVGGQGINLLHAGTGGDTLIGGASNDFLFGGSGNDRLI